MKALILIGMFLLQQPQPAGVISGRIVFKDGLPAARMVVTAAAVSAPARPLSRAFTDESGSYRAEGLPAGSYYVRVAFPSVNLTYPGVVTDGEATPVTIAQGAAVNNIDVVIPDFLSGVRVSGRVVLPPGQTASATTRVQLQPQGVFASIAADGTFEFRHVLSGTYAVSYPSPGMQPFRIAVAEKEITNVELKVPRLVPVTGTVTAEGGVRPALTLMLEGPALRTTVPVQPNGTFSVQLPEGPYLIAVSGGTPAAAGRAPTPPVFPVGYYLMSFGNESQNLLLTDMLRISPSDSAVRLAIALGKSSGVKVTGHIKTSENDSGVFTSKKVTLVSAPANLSAEASINADGSFEIPKMMPGTYSATVALTPEVRSNQTTVVVPNRDLSGLELTVPVPVEVTGRVAVDGNGPPPRFSLALVQGGNFTPAVDANGLPTADPLDLLVLARGGAHVISVDVSALPDGSFRMTLPQGDYRVVPSVQSPAYFIRSLTHGSTRLLTEPLHVSDSERAELHIGFGAKAANSWKKVSGRVSGLDSSKGPARVALQSRVTATIETPVNPDGTFEFLSVLPGTSYTARVIPANDATPSPTVTVADKDVEGVTIVVPREREVSISASVEGNVPVPAFMLSLLGRSADGGRSVVSFGSALIKPEVDGSFKARLPEDEREVWVGGFPLGYSVKSMTYGSVDLLKNPLKLAGAAPSAIQITFAVDPSVPFGNLQGRVVGLDPEHREVRLILNGGAAFSTFETVVSPGGSFSFSKIPQGTYVPTLTGDVVSGLLTPTTIVVTGRDIAGIEITFPKGSTRPNRPDIEPAPTGATASDLSNLNSSTSRLAANESAAVANLRTLNTALLTYRAASGGKYGNIAELISAGLLDSSFNGVKADFTYSIVTVGSEYAAVGTPASGETTRYGYYTTSDAVIRFSPLAILAPPRRSGNPVQ